MSETGWAWALSMTTEAGVGGAVGVEVSHSLESIFMGSMPHV